jgi:hypothetical protein
MSKEGKSSPRLRGRVLSFNLSPKGYAEGALVETATGLAQLNFPRRESGAFARSMHIGGDIDLVARLERDHGDHPVYKVRGEQGEANGTIARLNYTLEGEVNGYHLDDGTFLHVHPEEAKKYKLQAGETVKATGVRHPGSDAVVLEVRAVERARKLRDDGARA